MTKGWNKRYAIGVSAIGILKGLADSGVLNRYPEIQARVYALNDEWDATYGQPAVEEIELHDVAEETALRG